MLEVHKKGLNLLGFWQEEGKSSVIIALMSQYRTDVIRDYMIIDVIVKDNESFVIKWKKRFKPLSDEELLEKWNRNVKVILE